MAAVSDWHPDPANTASFEAITLTNLPPATAQPRPPGRHRASTEPRPGVAPGTRRLAYAAAFLGLAVAVLVVAWGATRSTEQGAAQPLTPLGTVAPYPLTTVPPAPTDTLVPEASLADAGTYTAPPVRSAQPRVLTRRPTVTVRRVIPAPVVTTTSVPVTTSPVPTETAPEVTTDAAEPEVQSTRWHRGWDRQQWRVRDSGQSGLLGITGP